MSKFVEQVLTQCAFSLGAGARMEVPRIEIELKALTKLQDIVRRGFEKVLDVGKEDWGKHERKILACCEEIGRLAARKADDRHSVFIQIRDLQPAYKEVRDGNAPPPGREASKVLGDFCPDWP